MDEFCSFRWHRMIRCRGIGVSSWHQINRHRGVGAICSTGVGRAKWHRMIRRCQAGASEQSPEDVPESMSSVLKPSLQHRMIRRAPEHSVGAMMSADSRRSLQHRMIRCTPDKPTPPHRFIRCLLRHVSEAPTANPGHRVTG